MRSFFKRRAFLKRSAVLGSATVAAVAAPQLAANCSEHEEEKSSPEPKTQKGYQETEHVKTYYQTLRD